MSDKVKVSEISIYDILKPFLDEYNEDEDKYDYDYC